MPRLSRKLVSLVVLLLLISALLGCVKRSEVGYFVSNGEVRWAGKKVDGADPATFEWIGNNKEGKSGWGKDAQNVYFHDIIVPGADSKTFEVMPLLRTYARDCKRVYIGSTHSTGKRRLPHEFSGLERDLFKDEFRVFARDVEILDGADGATFEEVAFGWYRDKNHVYKMREIFAEADAATFREVKQHGRRWFTDKNHVFLNEYIVEHADPRSYRIDPETRDTIDDRFVYISRQRLEVEVEGEMIPVSSRNWRSIGRGYRTDGEFVFDSRGHRTFPGIDAKSFEMLEGRFAKDRNKVYFDGNPLVGADSATFEVISGRHTRDKNYVWFGRKRIEGADPASFRVLNERFGVDKNFVWLGEYTFNKIADPGSFEVLDNVYCKDRSHVWKRSKLIAYADAATFEVVNGKPRDKKGPVRVR